MKRLRNSTAISDAVARAVERFVCPPGVRGFDLELRNGNGFEVAGRAYTQGSGYHSSARPFVVCRIGPDKRFPSAPKPKPVGTAVTTVYSDGRRVTRTNSPGGYLHRPYLANRVEALVYVLAHELRHLWQARVPKGRRVWGSRGVFSERDADAYAIRKLREWRKAEQGDA